jgi:hypothetical protein
MTDVNAGAVCSVPVRVLVAAVSPTYCHVGVHAFLFPSSNGYYPHPSVSARACRGMPDLTGRDVCVVCVCALCVVRAVVSYASTAYWQSE